MAHRYQTRSVPPYQVCDPGAEETGPRALEREPLTQAWRGNRSSPDRLPARSGRWVTRGAYSRAVTTMRAP